MRHTPLPSAHGSPQSEDILTIGISEEARARFEKEASEGTTMEGKQPQRWRRYEHSRTFADRRLRMPQEADLNTVSAKMCNGVLCLRMNKVKAGESPCRGQRQLFPSQASTPMF